MNTYDYIIVGSGIAGLYSAILASEHGSVLVVTKGSIEECNTRHAQGGIAAPIGVGDSPGLHMQDTLAAGAGLSDPKVVRILTEEATDRIHDLVRFGVPFDTVHGEVALTREAAHSVSRVLHAGGDATGEHIESTLSSRARESGVRILEYHLATHVLVQNGFAQGIRVLDCRGGAIQDFSCRFLIMATGGAGQLFQYNTNPEVTTGDGIAIAFRAGAKVADMEFFQFHPTAQRIPGAPPFLISEAVRGEGGILRNVEGRAFAADYHPAAELAPRDVVARFILTEMQRTGSDHVLLDVTRLPASQVTTRFPSIYRFCLDHGIDMTRSPIPVAPAAHYMMGGIKTNSWGQTNIGGLYACGEAACNGVHGANRLASNSLIETLVFGQRVIERTLEDGELVPESADETLYALEPPQAVVNDPPPATLEALQRLLWEKVGIVRSGESLEEAKALLATWDALLPEPHDRPSWELRNLVLLGRLMTQAALIREESRGAHFRTDFPQPRPEWQHHIVFKKS